MLYPLKINWNNWNWNVLNVSCFLLKGLYTASCGVWRERFNHFKTLRKAQKMGLFCPYRHLKPRSTPSFQHILMQHLLTSVHLNSCNEILFGSGFKHVGAISDAKKQKTKLFTPEINLFTENIRNFVPGAFYDIKNFYRKQNNGQDDKGAAKPLHGIHTQQGNQTRNGGAPLSVCPRVPVPGEPPAAAGTSGHRDAQVSHGHLRQRLFLARPWRLQTFCHAKEQDRLLASEDWTQQKQGQGGAETACQHGVALYHGMGMSTEAKGKGGNPSVARLHHQPHLCRRPQVKTVCAAGRRKRHCSRTWCWR